MVSPEPAACVVLGAEDNQAIVELEQATVADRYPMSKPLVRENVPGEVGEPVDWLE